MRFEWIGLDRYGCFTEHKLNFGSGSSGKDFHIVYGPNEAGKSTIRQACIDFLYGFPLRTPYNFIHNYETLQLSAAVRTNSTVCEGKRIKRPSGNFLASDGSVASDAVSKAVLGDISSDGFAQMFSLNDDSLEAGSESILNSEGDLGSLLFSAVSGLSLFNVRLKEAQEKANGFYKKAARNSRLGDLRDKLDENKTRLREIDMQASAYATLKEAESAAKMHHTEAKSERDTKAKRISEIKKLLAVTQSWSELKQLQAELEPLSGVPEVPEGWLPEAEKLVATEASTRTALQESISAESRCREKYDQIILDPLALEIAEALKRLAEDKEARFITSSDIEHRQLELKTIENSIRARIQKISPSYSDKPHTLLLPVTVISRLRELSEQHKGLITHEALARQEWEAAEATRETASANLAKMVDSTDLSIFAEKIESLKAQVAVTKYNEELQRHNLLEEELNTLIQSLFPWKGNKATLLHIPEIEIAYVQQLKKQAQELATESKMLDSEKERIADKRAMLQAELDILRGHQGLISDEIARTIRATRETAWVKHTAFLTQDNPDIADVKKTATDFETAMLEDDRTSEVRLARASELTDLRRAQLEYATNTAETGRIQEKLEMLEAKKTDHATVVTRLFEQLGVPETTLLDSVEPWLIRRGNAVAKAQTLMLMEKNLKQLQIRHEENITAIDAAMAEIGLAYEGIDWNTKIKRCEKAIGEWQECVHTQKAAEEALKNAVLENTRRTQTHKKVNDTLLQWQQEWQAELAKTWIGIATPAAVKAIVEELDNLSAELAESGKLYERIAAMTADRNSYQQEVKRLAETIGSDYDDSDPLSVAARLRLRASTAKENERTKRICHDELNTLIERRAKVELEITRIETRIAQMCEPFGVKDLTTLLHEMRRSQEKRKIEGSISQLKATLQKQLDVKNPTAIHETLEALAISNAALDEMEQELIALEKSLPDEDSHISSLYHEWKKAEDKLAALGADDEAAKLEEQQQATLLEIQEEAENFVRLSAGIILVNKALHAYRETHRSSMMEQANNAFVRMTRGAFKGLSTTLSVKNSEVLVGIRNDGSSIIASEMSRGTRFQLYLALRIAGHAEFAKHRESLPFFADDIFEPFDDERSAETFALLHEMSGRGQVVYLTHHRHLCDIAKKVCGDGVTIHELPDRAVHGLSFPSVNNDKY